MVLMTFFLCFPFPLRGGLKFSGEDGSVTLPRNESGSRIDRHPPLKKHPPPPPPHLRPITPRPEKTQGIRQQPASFSVFFYARKTPSCRTPAHQRHNLLRNLAQRPRPHGFFLQKLMRPCAVPLFSHLWPVWVPSGTFPPARPVSSAPQAPIPLPFQIRASDTRTGNHRAPYPPPFFFVAVDEGK